MNPVYSRFRLYAYSTTLYIFGLPIFAIGMALYLQNKQLIPKQMALSLYYKIICFSALVTAVYWYFNTRKWMAKVIVDRYGIRAKGFYGLGKMREWRWSELEGYAIRKRWQKYHGTFEELSVLQGGKAVLVIVEPVYANYKDIKDTFEPYLKHIPE